jgi:quercetin dioxygenase-like cupin family protein
MTTATFEEFQTAAQAAGADEVLVRQWGPDAVIAEHTHSFSVEAVVTQGEMWLTCGGTTRHLKVGDTFSMAREVLHAERYGPEGATYWVARRNAS